MEEELFKTIDKEDVQDVLTIDSKQIGGQSTISSFLVVTNKRVVKIDLKK